MSAPGANNQDFRTIPSLWPDMDGAIVLDLGCGGGLYTNELARLGATGIGVDMNRGLLREAREQAVKGRRHFLCADADKLPFRDGVFDMVLSVEVLTHIPPQARARVFAAVANVLKDGGCANYTLHNRLRLTLSRWLRGRRALEVYPTNNLHVWPLDPAQASEAIGQCAMRTEDRVRFLNYHSRFSHAFCVRRPHTARFVMFIEDVLCRLPVLRRLAITFLVVARKPVSSGASKVKH